LVGSSSPMPEINIRQQHIEPAGQQTSNCLFLENDCYGNFRYFGR
jgi:hypothetical protein